MSVLVHKAVEPKNLSKTGKQRFARLLTLPDTILQHKYDGVYCQLVRQEDGSYMPFSRTGEPMPSVPAAYVQHFGKVGTADRYIGELWAQYTAHADINGMARRQYEQPNLELVLFDSHDMRYPDQPYLLRHNHIYHVAKQTNMAGVKVADNKVLGRNAPSLDSLYTLAKALKVEAPSAYDGLMLKDPEGLFIPGPGKDGEVIKIKPRASGDFRVVGVIEGKGKAAGMAGALVLDLGGGVSCEVGTGLDDDTRRDYWQWFHSWGAGTGTSGIRIAEIEYLSITKDGKLREPSFKSTRWDKTVADVLPGNIKGED